MAKYSFEFKLEVVKAYLNGDGGYGYLAEKFNVSSQHLALKVEMNNPSLIASWVSKFREQGVDGLSNKKGCPPKMKPKEDKKEIIEKHDANISESERIGELEKQVRHLQIENAYLKELRRLRLEETRKMKKSQGSFKLKEILAVLNFPKSTYMYWQKRFDRENPDKDIEEKILSIREKHKNYGYRRIHGELLNKGYKINKKKVQRIVQKLNIQVISFSRKSRKYNSYRGKVGKIAPNRISRRFDTNITHQKITTDTTEFKYYEKDKNGVIQIKKLYLDYTIYGYV